MYRCLCVLFLILFFSKGVSALNSNKYAAVVINPNTGDIIISASENEKRYPATLTKLMTAYVALKEIKRKNMLLNDETVVSKSAAEQSGKTFNLRFGQRMSIKNLLLSMVILSANDSAVALAEEIGGSVDAFAKIMNEAAVEIGMYNTNYTNPTGIHDARQFTTAKDIAVLLMSLRSEFREFYNLISQKGFVYNGNIFYRDQGVKSYYKHLYNLCDGYEDSSGYNTVTSFEFEENSISLIILGMANQEEAQQHIREVMDYSVKRVFSKNNTLSNMETHTKYSAFLASDDSEDLNKISTLYLTDAIFKVALHTVGDTISNNSQVLMRNLSDNLVVNIEKDSKRCLYKMMLAVYPKPLTKDGVV